MYPGLDLLLYSKIAQTEISHRYSLAKTTRFPSMDPMDPMVLLDVGRLYHAWFGGLEPKQKSHDGSVCFHGRLTLTWLGHIWWWWMANHIFLAYGSGSVMGNSNDGSEVELDCESESELLHGKTMTWYVTQGDTIAPCTCVRWQQIYWRRNLWFEYPKDPNTSWEGTANLLVIIPQTLPKKVFGSIGVRSSQWFQTSWSLIDQTTITTINYN